MFLLLLATLLLGLTPSSPLGIDAAAVGRNYYQYRVGWLRPCWRTDWVLHTVALGADTIGRDLTTDEMWGLGRRGLIPDDARVDFLIVRFEQRSDGTIIRGPILVRGSRAADQAMARAARFTPPRPIRLSSIRTPDGRTITLVPTEQSDQTPR